MATAPINPVPVFPLPNLVLFPHAALDLHVFELRYRTMVRDALSGERFLALATLKPGWEADYHGSPDFHDLGCVGKFEVVEWLPNDCYNLRVRGVERVRFVRTTREFPYRACRTEPLPSAPYDEADPLAAMERDALAETLKPLLPLGAEAWLQPPLAPPDATLEVAVAHAAQAARLGVAEKLELLAMDSVFERSRRLRELLPRLRRDPPAAPGPSRSVN